ncbi:glycosyltransferase involved in cell wall biosynthesis [Lewinella aquimaris]|uniref:Glycosyltransferase involved in cell wall biosynthesis n=1 Tax=Neolewinella aquimaris TaxID=1835722 RepID=A0A840EAB7_9BACT|nr:glycosyltransferase [Neolewinella aquimaris]MBB4080495.1 glycosyltransferase involved in cell wall biosynthesis [Neolewinella aquimaris]
MKVLYVTNMYPTESNPVFGIFVKEQIEDAARYLDVSQEVYLMNGVENGWKEYLKAIFVVPWKIMRGNYDLIHVHFGLSGLWRLFYRPNVPVFLSLHGADILEKQGRHVQVAITKKLLPTMDRVFTLNEEMNTIVSQYTDAYEMLPCSVNVDLFRPVEREATQTDKLLLFPGSPRVPVKDFPLFERVLEKVRKQTGSEVAYATLENLSRTGVRDLMNRADCLVMTSVSEGSPQVVKEALSCGLPVVSVNVGDVASMLEGVPYCTVTETRDPVVLAAAVGGAFTGDRERIRRAFIDKRIYDHESISRRWAELYTRVGQQTVRP